MATKNVPCISKCPLGGATSSENQQTCHIPVRMGNQWSVLASLGLCEYLGPGAGLSGTHAPLLAANWLLSFSS